MEEDQGARPEGEAPREEPTPVGEPEVQLAGPVAARLAAVVQADQVDIGPGAALVVMAEEANIDRAGSVVTVARNLTLERGGSQWLIANQANLRQSGAGIVVSQQVDAPDARIGITAAGSVSGNLQVGVLLAGRVEGNVQALVDTEAATRFGIAFGAILGFALLLRRLLANR